MDKLKNIVFLIFKALGATRYKLKRMVTVVVGNLIYVARRFVGMYIIVLKALSGIPCMISVFLWYTISVW